MGTSGFKAPLWELSDAGVACIRRLVVVHGRFAESKGHPCKLSFPQRTFHEPDIGGLPAALLLIGFLVLLIVDMLHLPI